MGKLYRNTVLWMTRPGKRPWLRREIWALILLFLLALGLRLLFWQATPDSAAPYPAYYKGDAPSWLAYASALQESRLFELGLPLRPPGVGHLLALVWNGEETGLPALRFLWCLLGALTVPLIFLSVSRSFGFRVGVVAGLLTAGSTGLMILSSSLNNEVPYLLLLVLGFTLWESLRQHPRVHHLALWSTCHALACLIRVEHVLLFLLLSVCLVWAWRDKGWKGSLSRSGLTFLFFLAVLVPWHAGAWARIDHFNTEPPPLNPATERALNQIERALTGLTWAEGAERERDRLPAFTGRTSANFVAATVALRGKTRVTGDDFEILEEAFGSRPQHLDSHPFVALYGGLNFFLANNPEATGGFNRAPLEKPPPLAGGSSVYPRSLIVGLPPPLLTLAYPPHLEVLNRGYRMGVDWIWQHPGDYLSLALRKARYFWEGATLGLGGYNFPMGLSGTRRAVDLVVPAGDLPVYLWRGLLLIFAVTGLWAGRRHPGLIPWLLLLATKMLMALAFFGYAREGATVIPVLALLTGLGTVRCLGASWSPVRAADRSPARWLLASLLAGFILIGVEGFRWSAGPVVTLDGREIGKVDPFPESDYQDRHLQVK